MYNVASSSNQGYPLPATQAGGFHVQSSVSGTETVSPTIESIDTSSLPQPVAAMVASVARNVDDQVEVARIRAGLKGAFLQVLPNPLDLLSTGITGDKVEMYADLVRNLTAMRKFQER